jgi:hypothetical protein
MTKTPMTISDIHSKANEIVNEFGGRVWAAKEPRPGDDIREVGFYAAKAKLRRAFKGATIVLDPRRLIIIMKDGVRVSIGPI